MKSKTMFAFVLLIFCLACAGRQRSVKDRDSAPTSDKDWAWILKIIDTDASQYPRVKLQGVVLDSSGSVVKNLAPPYGHLDDWQEIWVPLVQQHPMWGEREYRDFEVTETQSENIDTTGFLALLKEEEEIELQIAQGEEAFKEVIERVLRRKQQLLSSTLELMRNTSAVLVMDVSGSMTGEPLLQAQMAAAEFVEYSEAEIALIAFDDRVYKKAPFTRDRGLLITTVLALSSGGGTHLYDALYEAIDMLKGRSGEKHIIALTDGQTGGDQYTLEQIINFANSGDISVVAQTGTHTKLFTIGLGFAGGNLRALAAQTGGKYYFTNQASELLEIFSEYIGFELEQTRKSLDLYARIERVRAAIEQIKASVFRDYHYDISFTSRFPTEDGLDMRISFKFGGKTTWNVVKIPVSQKELLARGYVLDEQTQHRVPNASVTINPQKIDTTFVVTTDSAGYFEKRVIRTNNRYSVFAEAEGYFISTKEYRLARPDSFFVTVQLKVRKAEVGASAAIRSVHFENNEFLFEPISFPDLISMGSYLVQHPEFRIEIAGHTDSFGKDSYNQWLSERRAEIVAEFFASLGVPEENLEVRGYGESKPLVPDTSEENRYMNRRVEITLVGVIPKVVGK